MLKTKIEHIINKNKFTNTLKTSILHLCHTLARKLKREVQIQKHIIKQYLLRANIRNLAIESPSREPIMVPACYSAQHPLYAVL